MLTCKLKLHFTWLTSRGGTLQDLKPQGDPTVPCLRDDTQVSCRDFTIKENRHHCVFVCVAVEHLGFHCKTLVIGCPSLAIVAELHHEFGDPRLGIRVTLDSDPSHRCGQVKIHLYILMLITVPVLVSRKISKSKSTFLLSFWFNNYCTFCVGIRVNLCFICLIWGWIQREKWGRELLGVKTLPLFYVIFKCLLNFPKCIC